VRLRVQVLGEEVYGRQECEGLKRMNGEISTMPKKGFGEVLLEPVKS